MSSELVRVLVVDDSAVVRSTIVRILQTEPTIKVVGTAGNGLLALDAVATLAPDVVTLDVEMPGMGGMEFLKRVRAKHPLLPIIMFSQSTRRGALDTVEALSLGATDYVSKPSYSGSAEAASEQVRSQLVPKILALKGARTEGARAAATIVPRRPLSQQRAIPAEIVVVGSSTGGPAALDEIICTLPKDFPVPVVVVQQMPPSFVQLLADRMSRRARVSVAEARHGEAVLAGKVLLAPGDRHMVLRREGANVVVELNSAPALHGSRPAADLLFKSAAKIWGGTTLGVVLSGMGQDGLEGSRSIVEQGGRVIAQDEFSSVVWGMPGQVVKAGLADAVLSIKAIAGELVTRTRPPSQRGATNP